MTRIFALSALLAGLCLPGAAQSAQDASLCLIVKTNQGEATHAPEPIWVGQAPSGDIERKAQNATHHFLATVSAARFDPQNQSVTGHVEITLSKVEGFNTLSQKQSDGTSVSLKTPIILHEFASPVSRSAHLRLNLPANGSETLISRSSKYSLWARAEPPLAPLDCSGAPAL